MKKNKLKEKIERQQTVFGLFVSIPHPSVIELIGHAEFDFVIIDLEHTTINLEILENMIRAAELLNITPLVRIDEIERTSILKVLDCGAQGIVIPHVSCREQVIQVIEYSYYHPIGQRSLNSGRPAAFAKNPLTEYIAAANEEIMIIPMIENVEGVHNCKDILSLPQISFVLEGAADLSQSLAVPWQTGHPKVQNALEELHEIGKMCHVPYATVSREKEQHRRWADRGVRIFVLGDDRNTAFRAYRQKKIDYQKITGG
jgi:4-hydroxy-2-oxoheptanedioate aldolase